jgi:hypothetical protein
MTDIPKGSRRWMVQITYRSDNGVVIEEYDIEELDELEEIVESGPHWDAISDIVIIRGRDRRPTFTIEDAERE